MRRRRNADRWRSAERVSLWAAVCVTVLWAIRLLSVSVAERLHDVPVPRSAFVLRQSVDGWLLLGQEVRYNTTLFLNKTDGHAFIAQIKRKPFSGNNAVEFGFTDTLQRDNPDGSRAFLCKSDRGDALVVTVDPAQTYGIVVHLTTVWTD